MTENSDISSSDQPSPQDSFGDYLKKQREASGKTIQEIAAITKISSRYLEAFEANDMNRFPPKTFTRGFLKNYAEEVGIDVDECMERFDQFQRSLMPTQIKDVKKTSETSNRIQADDKTAQLNMTLIIAGVVGVLLVALTLVFLSNPPSSESSQEATISPQPIMEDITPAFPEDPASDEEAAPEEKKAEPEPVVEEAPALAEEEVDDSMEVPVTPSILEVEALKETSLKIKLDGGNSQTIRLASGDRKTFSVKREVEIRNIRRGSIRFLYNGKPLEVAGQMIKLFNRNLFNQKN